MLTHTLKYFSYINCYEQTDQKSNHTRCQTYVSDTNVNNIFAFYSLIFQKNIVENLYYQFDFNHREYFILESFKLFSLILVFRGFFADRHFPIRNKHVL